MGACKRKAFTIVELAIGITLMLIISVPVYMTLKTGVDLYLKTEANAVVTNGVRFTMDSFSRRISPMLNETTEIEVLQDPEIPETVPKYMNYVYLSGDSVVYRDSSGDHLLEGSEHITGISFTLPTSADESPDNFILHMSVTGSYKTAKLNIDAKETLYNTPVKDGNNIAGDNYEGNVIFFKTPGINEMSVSLDLYDNDTKIKINNSTMPKGTVILASYDLNITRDDINVSFTDESSLDWYISGSRNAPLKISTGTPTDDTTKENWQFQLVDNDNNPITAKTFDTKGYGASGDFYIRTGTDTKTKWEYNGGGYGAIRCRLLPGAITSRGKTITGTPVWSGYVEIKNKTFWETWLDAISGVDPTEGFYNTNYGLDDKVQLEVITSTEELAIGIKKSAKIKAAGGAFTVARLDYKYLDNDRLYSIWKDRPSSSSSDTVPTLMTVTNYSVLVSMRMNDIAMFGMTLSNTPNTTGGVVDTNLPFNDLGYSVIMSVLDHDVDKGSDITSKGDFERGVFVHALDGSTTSNQQNTTLVTRGIENCYYYPLNDYYDGNAYSPAQIQNSRFGYEYPDTWWRDGYHRVLYTVLEYYDKYEGETRPRYIIRVRFLKQPAELNMTAAQLAALKVRDPWFIGPEFFASEPMWFGDFVGNKISADNKTVDVRRYNASLPNTVVASDSSITHTSSDSFYGLLYSSIKKIFKKRTMDLYEDAKETNGGLTDTRLSLPNRDRYLGMMVYVKTPTSTETMNIYDINLVPGFTADEIRSILPANAKLYEISETVPSGTRMPTDAMAWYGPDSPARNYNDAVFGTNGMSDGSGNNGSRYNSAGAGIIGLQHVPSSCTCPLENEIFKWLDK